MFPNKCIACNVPGSEPMAVTMAAVKIKARVSVGLGNYKSVGIGKYKTVGLGKYKSVGLGKYKSVGLGKYRSVGLGKYKCVGLGKYFFFVKLLKTEFGQKQGAFQRNICNRIPIKTHFV